MKPQLPTKLARKPVKQVAYKGEIIEYYDQAYYDQAIDTINAILDYLHSREEEKERPPRYTEMMGLTPDPCSFKKTDDGLKCVSHVEREEGRCCGECYERIGGGSTMLPLVEKCSNTNCPNCHAKKEEKDCNCGTRSIFHHPKCPKAPDYNPEQSTLKDLTPPHQEGEWERIAARTSLNAHKERKHYMRFSEIIYEGIKEAVTSERQRVVGEIEKGLIHRTQLSIDRIKDILSSLTKQN